MRTLVVQCTLGFISILGAKIGLGVYALLINPILGSILLFVVSYRCYPQHFWSRFDFAYSRSLMSYSFFQIGFNLLNFSYRNIDKLLIGKYFGLDKLGYYEKSYRLMMMPLENVSNVINPVLHPLLCEHQEDWHFVFDKYTKVVSYFAYIGFPLTAFLYFSARDIVLLLFGPQWAPSIPVFSILALSVGIQLIQSAVGAVFQAVGRVKQMFYAGVLSFLATICAIIVGVLNGSLTVLAIYIVIAFYAAFFIYHEMLMHYVFQQSLIHFLPILVRPVIAGFCIALVLWGGKQIIPNISVPVLQLLINASLSVLTFIVLQHLRIIQGIPILINVIKYGLLRFRAS